MDLFTKMVDMRAPLADRMRPRTMDEFIGQEHIVGEGKLLRRAILTDSLTSSIFFGPPGCGKTTLASIVANTTGAQFAKLNAVTAGVKEVREIIADAEERLKLYGSATYLLLDECHRWSKTQSDCILPALEKGIIKFVGSTTENPMISMTGAIISRCRIFQFYPLSTEHVALALTRALADTERGFGKQKVEWEKEALNHLARTANGDIRIALNALELAVLSTKADADGSVRITEEIAAESIQRKVMVCGQEQYYNMLSAFCKSLRGSDADAALAWFARMTYAGVDPRVIVRRMVAHASEDVGLSNPQALTQAVAAMTALEHIGMPEARLPISQAIIYICESPKSNAVCTAMLAAFAEAEKTRDEPVPLHLRDTSYSGAAKLGHGKGYQYPHDYEGHYIPQQYMPLSVQGHVYYEPSDQGQEAKIKENHERRQKWSPDEPQGGKNHD